MSIGKTGQYNHPDVLAAELKTITTALKKASNPRVELRDPGRPENTSRWASSTSASAGTCASWPTGGTPRGRRCASFLRAKPRRQHLPSSASQRKHQDVPPAAKPWTSSPPRQLRLDTGELPVAPRRPFRRTLHGVTLTDDYAG